MSRLIDADELKEHVKSYAGMWMDEGFMVSLDAVMRGIDFQPTAYDIDKVVEQLEDWADYNENISLDEENNNAKQESGFQRMIAYKHAIEIVKGGGNNEDGTV